MYLFFYLQKRIFENVNTELAFKGWHTFFLLIFLLIVYLYNANSSEDHILFIKIEMFFVFVFLTVAIFGRNERENAYLEAWL